MTTRSKSLTRLLYLGLGLLVPGLALAGPNEGGTLILHANPGLVFTSDIQNYCGMAALDSCSAAVTSVPWEAGKRIVFHALAAFPSGSSPRLKSLSFGIDYDPAKFVMVARGSCADFELSDGTWPAPGTGTSQSWTTGAQTGALTECYWFCGYGYSEQDGQDSTSVALIPHPLQHGVFVDDEFPAEVDTIAAYARLGIGTVGEQPCPPTAAGDSMQVALQVVPSSVPEEIASLGLRAVGRLAADRRLKLAISLPLSDQSGLDDFVRAVSSPTSEQYRHYITPDEFAERFSPSERDYSTLIEFAQSHNLTATATYPNRLVLCVTGAVTDVERAFHVSLLEYVDPEEHRGFFAPDVEPSIHLDVPVLGIEGLDTFRPPLHHPPRAVAKSVGTGSGPDGTFWGSDFRRAYVPGATLTGTGEKVGLLAAYAGFSDSDIHAYEDAIGLSSYVPVQAVLVDWDGSLGTPDLNQEISMDIEMAIAMAPGLAAVRVYEGGYLLSPTLEAMVNDTSVRQFSSSWELSLTDAHKPLYMQLAAQGQSFFHTSGDHCAYSASDPPFRTSVEWPYATVVGGTELTTSSNGQAYVSEEVWNEHGLYHLGSGGGVSTHYAIPTWQLGINMAANGGSTTARNIPDVALTADNVYVIWHYGAGPAGGTSAAAPLWAGFTALVNQKAAADGLLPVGFLNPALYGIGKGQGSSAFYHDTTVGDNTWSPGSPSHFYAVPGYDLCTGWGTPTGALIDRLAGTGGGSVTAWGYNQMGECEVPLPNAGFLVIATGWGHSLGLRSDGSIAAWGENSYHQCEVPSPNSDFLAAAAGGCLSLGLKTDGSIVAWGDNSYGECDVPSPNSGFSKVAAGILHGLGLKGNGSVVAWGYNTFGQCNVPSPNVGYVGVAAGRKHSLGLKADGSIVAWGDNTWGQCDVPVPNTGFIAIAAGQYHNLGVKSDGSIVAWGWNGDGQCNVPTPNGGFVSAAGGWAHSLGLKTSGQIIAWGLNDHGQCDVPAPNAGFSAVGAGDGHSLGLRLNGGGLAAVGDGAPDRAPAIQCRVVPIPSSGVVQIAFEVPKAGAVSVRVFDPSGRVTRVLQNGMVPEGTACLRWDGRDERGRYSPTGVYFVRVDAPAGSTTQKIVLVRGSGN